MPELPHVSGAEAVRALERLGFEVVRQRGSHVMMRRGSAGCVVPLHREIKRGTLGGVLRQAGVDAESFIEALSR
ncbi:MAG: type II toxin-antitoxin system HicA family toxin [Acidimicrobiaceae bacterium]|nr:type II toxin-antitoxin system HicA family toxin [Ilumatobacter sp.]MCB9379498.1 type II toxin-antitoxin system HicA family toxin [Acidimicrobiaceae bacterium]